MVTSLDGGGPDTPQVGRFQFLLHFECVGKATARVLTLGRVAPRAERAIQTVGQLHCHTFLP